MVRMMNLPPLPDVPEVIRGKKFLQIAATCIGSKEEGETSIGPLRKIGEPLMDTFDQIPATGLTRIAMDPEPPVPGVGHHGVLSELTDEAIDAFYEAAGPESDSPLLFAELRHLGGALVPSRRERWRARQAGRRVRDALARDADGPGDEGSDRRTARQAR